MPVEGNFPIGGSGLRIGPGGQDFHFESVDTDCYRVRHRLQRDDQTFVAINRRQKPFYPIETSTANTDSLANPKKRMHSKPDVFLKQCLKILDLLVRDGSSSST